MKKRLLILLICLLGLPFWAASVHAAQTADDFSALYGDTFGSLDEETKDLLRQIGVSDTDLYTLLSLSPQSLFSVLKELFGSTAAQKAKAMGGCIAILLLVRIAASFLTSVPVRDATERLGGLTLAFVLISVSAGVADGCARAILLTKDFMLMLIPALGTVAAFSGNPVSAAAVNAVVLAFGEGVSVLFADFVSPLTAVGAALGCACVLSPVSGIEKFAAMINKTAVWIVGFTAGIFVAVLGGRGILAGAADSVTAKGIKFAISGGVPVVGSAISDALGSLNAGLGVVKNGASVLGVLAVVFINLPPLCGLLVWKLMLFLISFTAQALGVKKIPEFLSAFASVFNVLFAVMVFHMFVFVISLATIVMLKTG